MSEKLNIPEWGAVCVKLLQGPIYRTSSQDEIWNLLKTYFSDVNDYFSKIGVRVFIDDGDGYAFLKQILAGNGDDDAGPGAGDSAETGNGDAGDTSDDGENGDISADFSDQDYKRLLKLPRLIKNYPLSMELSLLCVILREALDQFDTSEDASSMLVMNEKEIKDRLVTFLPEKSDQTKVYAKIDEYLNKLVDLTFLREIKKEENADLKKDRQFEVRRIIRAKVNAEFLEEFKRKLEEL